MICTTRPIKQDSGKGRAGALLSDLSERWPCKEGQSSSLGGGGWWRKFQTEERKAKTLRLVVGKNRKKSNVTGQKEPTVMPGRPRRLGGGGHRRLPRTLDFI